MSVDTAALEIRQEQQAAWSAKRAKDLAEVESKIARLDRLIALSTLRRDMRAVSELTRLRDQAVASQATLLANRAK